MDTNRPNIGVLMVRIHNVITRGLAVSIERSAAFIKSGYPDAATQDAFITYARTLGSFINAHHLTEDHVVFPYLRSRLPEAPFDKLSADHRKMDVILNELQRAANLMAIQPDGGEPLKNLNSAVTAISDIWHPHIAIELANIYEAKKTDDVMTSDEQMGLMRDAAQYSMKEADPALAVAFILFNLEGEERAFMEHAFPPPFVQVLVPVVWKRKWEVMKPFLLD